MAERGKKKHQASLSSRLSAASIAVVGVAMIIGIAFKSQRSKGSCATDHTYKKVSCKNKHMKHIPDDLLESALTLHFGDKLDKQDNHFYSLERANFSKFSALKDLRLVKCGIEVIQSSTFSDLSLLQRLDLSYNKIQSLTFESFQGLKKLDYLNMSFNPIQTIGSGIFNGMVIDHLVIGNNPTIGNVPPDVFQGAQIKKIEFNKCNFQSLPEGLFQPLASSLQELTITNNVQPLKLPDKIFRNLKLNRLDLSNNGIEDAEFGDYLWVEHIILNNNPLTELDFNGSPLLENTKYLYLENTKLKSISKKNLSKLKNLEILDVSDNDLTTLNLNEWLHLTKLSTLDLSNNELTDFEGDFKAVLPGLKILYLHGNFINTLPTEMEGLFKRLEKLTLHENPLHCNCEVKWLARWLEVKDHRKILQQYDSVMCHTPSMENLTQISDYGFQCRKPTIVNATLDVDRVGLICTADGDPAPKVTWISPKGEEKTTHPHTFKRVEFQMINSLPVTRAGNYTCIAENILGTETVVVNTETMPTMGLKFHVKSQEIEILETPTGFCITCLLIGLLGYIFRNS